MVDSRVLGDLFWTLFVNCWYYVGGVGSQPMPGSGVEVVHVLLDSVEDGVSAARREGVLDIDAAHDCSKMDGEMGGDGSVASPRAILAEAVLVGAGCFSEVLFEGAGYGSADYVSDDSSTAKYPDTDSV